MTVGDTASAVIADDRAADRPGHHAGGRRDRRLVHHRQIARLQTLQTDLADRNRKDSLQLLRIQNDLNSLALAMRDMLDNDEPYPLTAWSTQFDRIRVGPRRRAAARGSSRRRRSRTPEQQQYLTQSVAQFWDAADRIFALARDGREDEARAQIRLSLQARQAALGTAVARLLVENNEAEEETARTRSGDLRDRSSARFTGSLRRR